MPNTYVYVSNAADGEIGCYQLLSDGALQPRARAKAREAVGPLAVSPDRRYLYAAVRSQPFAAHAYAIDADSGALALLEATPLAASVPYISLDRSGRWLLAASYHSHLVLVHAVGVDGRVGAQQQLITVGRNAHSIRVDESNRYAFVPTLGSDQVFQFEFDVRNGRLRSNTPAIMPMPPGTGPRHFVTSADNRYVYMLSELRCTVTTFSLNQDTGLLTEVCTASGLPPDTKLAPGAPRLAGVDVDRNRDHDIWAADIHLTPDGKFLYVSERTQSTLAGFAVDAASGTLRYLGSTPTETQPRGFAISPDGRYLIACGERSESISVYAIDAASGALRLLQRYPGGKGANWVEIVSCDG